MESTLKQAETQTRTVAITDETEKQWDRDVMELSNLELALVGGGVGAVIFL